MIGFVEGKVLEKGERFLLVMTGGIGYHLHVTGETAHALPIGENIGLYTHLAVKEDALDLYAKATQALHVDVMGFHAWLPGR